MTQALQQLAEQLPTGEVTRDWLEQAFSQMIEAVVKQPSGLAQAPAALGTELDLLSLLELPAEGPSSNSSTMSSLPALAQGRYLEPVRIGAGSQGVVSAVRDRYLERQVALKALRRELEGNAYAMRSFLREVVITGQLNHAGIVAIHDVFRLPEGVPGYTMRRIRGASLRDLFLGLRQGCLPPDTDSGGVLPGHPEALAREFGRRRLIELLQSVAHIVGYAHDRGVLHCDLKPANVMVGSYGEVLVLDWGIAVVLGTAAAHLPEGPVRLPEAIRDPLVAGVVRGTPGYMAPEQARGEVDLLGPWTDVFALGMMLYEALLNQPARTPGNTDTVLEHARLHDPELPRLRRNRETLKVPPIPEELEQIVMRCLERDTNARFPNGEALAQALTSYLDGERRRELALDWVVQGETLVQKAAQLHEEARARQAESDRLALGLEPWRSVEAKRQLWAREDAARLVERAEEEALTEAESLFTMALAEDPESRGARAGLARLAFDRLVEAETWGRQRDARSAETQLRRLDDGTFAEALKGEGTLRLTSEPSGLELRIFQIEERDRQRVPGREVLRLISPSDVRLSMGTYLGRIRIESGAEIRYPFVIRRQGIWEMHLKLPPALPPGFVLIPGGRFLMGGDRLAHGAGPRDERQVETFAMAALPVTCAEYLEFLQTLEKLDPRLASRRVPRHPGSEGRQPLWTYAAGKGYAIPRLDGLGGRWAPELPVRSVSRDDAEAYATWRARRDGRAFRLPSEAEWEKAGRGTDGRSFPWGDSFDASFCKMRDSRPGEPLPEEVGAFPLDCSPYGVRDMAGGVIEWVAGPFDPHGKLGIQKGGFWVASEHTCRLARRFGAYAAEPEKFAGFRLALSI